MVSIAADSRVSSFDITVSLAVTEAPRYYTYIVFASFLKSKHISETESEII